MTEVWFDLSSQLVPDRRQMHVPARLRSGRSPCEIETQFAHREGVGQHYRVTTLATSRHGQPDGVYQMGEV